MTKSVFTPDYERLRHILIETREAAGKSQRDIAAALDKPQSFVSKYETGERRLDVIEFIEVANALEIHPFSVLEALDAISGLNSSNKTKGVSDSVSQGIKDGLMEAWQITGNELNTLMQQNPSLRGMVLGYVAELKFNELWLKDERITSSFKHDDHKRDGKGDRVVTYKGEEFVIEVKSLQTNSVKETLYGFTGKAQVDGSDRRIINFPDGTQLETTLLQRGEFDILAVNIFAFTKKWDFVFAKNSDLPYSTFKKYTEAQRLNLIGSLVPITWPPQAPFSENPYDVLESLYQERQKTKGKN